MSDVAEPRPLASVSAFFDPTEPGTSAAHRRQNASTFCRLLAFVLFLFTALTLAVVALAFWVGQPVASWQVSGAFLLSASAPFLLHLGKGRKGVYLLLAFFALVILAIAAASSIADITCDGQTYHGAAIRHLMEGWNPVRAPDQAGIAFEDRVKHFSKGPWYCAAALCKATEKCEAGKAFNLLLIAAVWLQVFAAALRFPRLHLWQALLIATAVSANPVAINEAFSYYVDGQLASLFAGLVLSSCELLLAPRRLTWALLVLQVVVLVNVKLTAVVYAAGFLGCWFVFLAARRRTALLVPFASVSVAAMLTGFFVLGYNPYVTNWRLFGHPFYPYHRFSRGDPFRESIVMHQMPANFRELNRISALLFSMFAACENGYEPRSDSFQPATLKIPGSVSGHELACFQYVDTRVCGWGPLTGALFILTGIGAMVWLKTDWGKESLVPCAAAAGIFATIVAVPDAWWARFVPQLWLIPAVFVVPLWTSTSRYLRLLGTLLPVMMLANTAAIAAISLSAAIDGTHKLNDCLQALARRHQPCEVNFGYYPFNRLRFDEAHIPFQESPTLQPGPGTISLPNHVIVSETVVRFDENNSARRH